MKVRVIWVGRNKLGTFMSWDGPVTNAYKPFIEKAYAEKLERERDLYLDIIENVQAHSYGQIGQDVITGIEDALNQGAEIWKEE